MSDDHYHDALYMTDRRRTFIDSATNEVLLMEWSTRDDGWVPALQALSEWQSGALRVYSPVGSSTGWPALITMPGGGQWPSLLEHEAEDVRAVLSKPWIPDGQITMIREEDIDLMEAIRSEGDFSAEADHVAYLESLLRPALLVEMIPEFVSPLVARLAPAPAPAPAPGPRPRPTSAPILLPFPSHLIPAVLAHAASTGAICPIAMEPITTTNATVTSCGHIFQTAAIHQWLTDNDTCPECRTTCCC